MAACPGGELSVRKVPNSNVFQHAAYVVDTAYVGYDASHPCVAATTPAMVR
jgi:hypothetical protein